MLARRHAANYLCIKANLEIGGSESARGSNDQPRRVECGYCCRNVEKDFGIWNGCPKRHRLRTRQALQSRGSLPNEGEGRLRDGYLRGSGNVQVNRYRQGISVGCGNRYRAIIASNRQARRIDRHGD